MFGIDASGKLEGQRNGRNIRGDRRCSYKLIQRKRGTGMDFQTELFAYQNQQRFGPGLEALLY